MAKTIIDTEEEVIANEKPRKIGEISTQEGVQIETDATYSDDVFAVEAFMQEPVTISVHGSDQEGALPIISVIVNGTIQPIPRDTEIEIKRQYVEVLARAKTTSYRQTTNPLDPSDVTMMPSTVLSYPFSVVKDTQAGRAWLKKILAQS